MASNESPRTPKRSPHACECAMWEIGFSFDNEETGEPDCTIEATGCTRIVHRLFAQGHDARLKSLIIRAAVEGKEVRRGRPEGTIHTMSWEQAADQFGFGWQIKDAVLARLDKMIKQGKHIPPTPKTPEEQETIREALASENDLDQVDEAVVNAADDDPPLFPGAGEETTEPTIRGARGKVGRWVYSGTVNEDGSFTYDDAKGESKTAPEGKWTELS